MDQTRLRALELAVSAYSANPVSMDIVALAETFYQFLVIATPVEEPTGDGDYPRMSSLNEVRGQSAA